MGMDNLPAALDRAQSLLFECPLFMAQAGGKHVRSWTDAMPLIGLVYLLAAIGAGLWCWKTMEVKGRSGPAGFWLGFLFTLIGMLVVALLSDERRARPVTVQAAPPAAAGGTKVCPDCAEEVKAQARICRYCGHEFASA